MTSKNRGRREMARKALEVFRKEMGGGDTLEADCVDLIADLLHLCDKAQGVDALAVLRMASGHFEAEREVLT
jgi:hypothetical protein